MKRMKQVKQMKLLMFITFVAFIKCTFLASFLGLTACSLPQKNSFSQESRMRSLNHQLKQFKSQVENLKSENLVLRTKVEKQKKQKTFLGNKKSMPLSLTPNVHQDSQDGHHGDILDLTVRNRQKQKRAQVSATETYKKILSYYKKGDTSQLKYYVDRLLHYHPKSVYGDNALYLLGKHFYSLSNHPQALKAFNTALKNLP